MPDPSELIAVARRLAMGKDEEGPDDAEMRRAVSSAYYALFHTVTRAAAEQFMGRGRGDSAGYAIVCRGFDHRTMKTVCLELQVETLKTKYRRVLRTRRMSTQARDFAVAFPDLQAARHKADYDPILQLQPSEVSSLIDAAEVAMQAFSEMEAAERADVLALMLLGARD